jgi:hypothetical protein
MSIEFVIGSILSLIAIAISALGTVKIVTVNKLKAEIIKHLVNHSINTAGDVDAFVFQPIINYICDEHGKKPIDIIPIINGLIYEYDHFPIKTEETKRIKEKLLALIRESQTQPRDRVVRRQKQNTIHDYLVEFCAPLKEDTPYEVRALWEQFFEFLQKAGKEASRNGLRADIAYAIANNKSRYWYQAPNPENDSLFTGDISVKSNLLLYYPDESNKKIVKKFNFKITDDPTIYWQERGERMSIKFSELKKKCH